jgi:hypothetical protein
VIAAERDSKPRKKNVDELRIMDLMEAVCKPKNETGEWIRKLDIAESKKEKKPVLKLVEPGGGGHFTIQTWLSDIVTIGITWQAFLNAVMNASPLQDHVKIFSRKKWKETSSRPFFGGINYRRMTSWYIHIFHLLYISWSNKIIYQSKVCTKMTGRCKKTSFVPKDYKRVDESFETLTEKELEMERLMAKMEGSGVGGNVYSRDDMMDMYDKENFVDMADVIDFGEPPESLKQRSSSLAEESEDDVEPASAGKNVEF